MKKLTPINNVGLLIVLMITAAFVLTFFGLFQSCEDNAPEPESNKKYQYKIDGLKDLKKDDLIIRGQKERDVYPNQLHFDRALALPIDGKEVETLTCGYCDCEFEKGTGGNYGEYGEVCINCYEGLS